MPDGLKKKSHIILWISHVDSVLSVCNRLWISEWDVAAFKLSSETTMSRRQEYASSCYDPFSFLETYMTVNLFPVSGILKECYKVQHDSEKHDQMEAIHGSIDHLLYCMSTLWSARPSHSGPEDIRCCYSYRTVHCDTSEAARELKQTPPLSRTNWSFNYWGLFLCVCASGSTFWIPNPKWIQHSIVCVCIVLSVHVNYVYYVFVFCLLSSAEQSSAGV